MSKNICFMSFAYPWFFGPYGNQILKLSKKFIETGYKIFFISLSDNLSIKTYSYEELLKNDSSIKLNLDNETLDILSKITFIGGISAISGGILVSSINNLIYNFSIDCLISCMDLGRIIEDDIIRYKSLCWYPNHFNPPNKKILSKINVFSHVISLCETDCSLLKEHLPEKRIEYIPHIVEFDPPDNSITSLREKYKVPKDSFVVLINCGNYEKQNRKSIDTSLFAFDEFYSKYTNKSNNIFLYIHAWNIKKVNNNNDYIDIKEILNIRNVLSYTNIPESKYILNEEIMEYNEILELFKMSDLLLQGSKSEGFGIPILEAQLLGKPVLTTAFGAMKDYNYYGISVPPVQKYYDISSNGIMVTPSISGMAEALEKIYNNDFLTNDNRDYAINKIKENMNNDSVFNSFKTIIDEKLNLNIETVSLDESNRTSKIEYDEVNNILYLDGIIKESLCINDLNKNKDWVIFTYKSININNFLITKILLEASTNDTNLICLKTKYLDGKIYPTHNDLLNGNFNEKKIIYIVNSSIFKILVNNNNIEKQFLINYIFFNGLKCGNIKISPSVLGYEIK